MKYSRSINSFLLLAALASFQQAQACCYSCTNTVDEGLYRVDGGKKSALTSSEMQERNLQLWMKQTCISRKNLESALYGAMHIHFIEVLYNDLCKDDREAADFILLARQCEEVRKSLASPWYYAVEGDEPQTLLNQLAATAEQKAFENGRMAERYAVQAIRARFSLHQYAEIIAFWNNIGEAVQEPVLRDYALPYVAGCYYHLHDIEQALPIFLRYGDSESIKLCYGQYIDDERCKIPYYSQDYDGSNFENCSFERDVNSRYSWGANEWSITARFCPDSPNLGTTMKLLVDHLNYPEGYTSYYINWDNFADHVSLAEAAAQKSTGENVALWYYAAASLHNNWQQLDSARYYLKVARMYPMTPRMADYIHLLEADIFFRTAKVNKEYYSSIAQETTWMSDRIALSSADAEERSFWVNALKKILIEHICPKIEEAGDTQLHLKLTNFAENRGEEEPFTIATRRYYYRKGYCYNPRYSTRLFHLADSLSAQELKKYISWMQSPDNSFDKLLVSGSITDLNYWNEILGTHYLRERCFLQAEKALKQVSTSYLCSTNLYKEYCQRRDPFAVNPRFTDIGRRPDYKLQFAHRMVELEKKMKRGDANDRADAMLLYATGLYNSRNLCWSLTDYGWSVWGGNDHPYHWGKKHFGVQILELADEFEQRAFDLYTDRERKAFAMVEHNHRLEVMRDLADTQAAAELERHCDLWRDYAMRHANSPSE